MTAKTALTVRSESDSILENGKMAAISEHLCLGKHWSHCQLCRSCRWEPHRPHGLQDGQLPGPKKSPCPVKTEPKTTSTAEMMLVAQNVFQPVVQQVVLLVQSPPQKKETLCLLGFACRFHPQKNFKIC